ncbi:MAG: DsbA family protein [Kiloniellales bacterium]|nr:DsbA family protein [Kiloniellales bacterium]MDJ0980340.1 DsbA family protein [Kiloniellales bacterium]
MRVFICLGAAALFAAAVAASAEEPAAPNSSFGETETQAIEDIVRNYLLEHPEILLEAMQRLEEKERLAKIEGQRAAISANLEALGRDPSSPVLGNPDGDVTLVEFFDYRCPYCRKVTADLLDAVEKDGKIRLVFKEFPILGPESVVAARAALAAAEQDRYRDFHLALMTTPGQLDENTVLALASDLGLDVDRLRKDMESEGVEQQIRDNHRLGRALQINGTPAFVVGEEIVPGAVPMEQLLELVRRERAKTG